MMRSNFSPSATKKLKKMNFSPLSTVRSNNCTIVQLQLLTNPSDRNGLIQDITERDRLNKI